MKLEKIRFRNLASLHGEWTIDLTRKVFADAGIFALSGPVGSGKTTVFDAVRLALFGRTSRLERINQNDNEIMTRGTKDCFAELIFSNDKGRFLCRWSQHRASRTNNLQKAEHRLSEFKDGSEDAVILTSKLEETRERIREIIRMDFKHFSRAMILPQGQFASFLQAAPDERAPILEQITGTGIYAEISRKVHEKCRTLELELKSMQDSAAGIEILEPERIAELKKLAAENQEAVGSIKAEYDRKAGLLRNWKELSLECAGLETLRMELPNAERDSASAKCAVDEALKSLEAAKNDLALLSPLLLRVRELDTKIELETAHGTQAEKEYAVRFAANAAGAEKVESGRKKLAELNEKLRSIREYLQTYAVDSSLANELGSIELLSSRGNELRNRFTELEQNLKSVSKELEKQKKAIGILTLKRKQAEEELHAAESNLKEKNASGERLLGKAGSVSGFYASLEALRKQVKALEEILALCEEEQKLQMRKTGQEAFLKQNSENRKQNDELLAARLDLKKQLSEKLELLERQRLAEAKIASYEKDRKTLEEGIACPLCGSVHHPYAEKLPEKLPEDIFLSVRRDLDAVSGMVSDLEKRAAGFEIHAKNTEQEISRLDSELSAVHAGLETYDLNSFGLNRASSAFSGEIRAELAVRKERAAQKEQQEKLIRQNMEEKADTEKRFRLAEQELQRIDSGLERAAMEEKSAQTLRSRLSDDLAVKKNERDEVSASLNGILEKYGVSAGSASFADLLKQRSSVFEGNRRAEQALGLEIMRLSADLSSGAEQVRKTAMELEEQKQNLMRRKSGLDALIRSRTELFGKREPAEEERRANEKIKAAGLVLEQKNSLLREQSDRVNALKTRFSETQARIEKYRKLIGDPPEPLSVPELESQLAELDALRQEKSRVTGECNIQQETSERNRRKASALFAEIEKKSAVQRKWEFLNSLIGSSDGKKYRSFVQSLTLETLIENANEQLARFSDRYTLAADSVTGLEFNVMDAYRGNEVRSTRNLSGGETFIVSLALALGLSRMARNRVQIDTLFLDEGFGTLDEETLQHALEQLAGLKQSGKLIGIITHAHGIEDAVPVVLRFECSSGHSTVSGPGVSGKSGE